MHALALGGVTAERLCSDSRTVRSGDVFVAYPGESADGRDYIAAAIGAGACAVICEHDGFKWDDAWTVPHVMVRGLRALAGPIAHIAYGRPSEALWVAGVTGTNGKTSTSQWLTQALGAAHHRAAVVGTLGLGFPGALEDNPNTTPDPIVLHAALARFLAAGADCVAMEVSSIGLDQGRVNGVAFDCAVFTNLTRDHLDYHGTMEAYAQVKMRLFESPTLTHAVLNLDDPVGVRIARAMRDRGVRRIGFSATATAAPIDVETLLSARRVRYGTKGLEFAISDGASEVSIATTLVGGFNAANLLAVCGALLAAGIDLQHAAQLIARLAPVPGRMQQVTRAGGPMVVIDYAHSPDALDKVLAAGRELAAARGGRLIAVFGCGGDRDRGKRPQMGAVAARHADHVVVTSDNPRSEDPAAIVAAIVEGLAADLAGYEAIVDRREAIRQAITAARSADVIVLAGKGHEPYQEINGVRHPFSDAAEAAAALEASA